MSELLHVAILGTAQTPASTPSSSGTAADPLVDAMPELERERALLLRAGTAGVLRRAGRLPSAPASRDPEAPLDTRRAPSARLVEQLAPLLEANEPALLEHVLGKLAEAGFHFPEELLPSLLAVGSGRRASREPIRRVLGTHGVWLAARRPEWEWALAPATDEGAPPDLEKRFAEGSPSERLALFTIARRADAAKARALLESSWKQEKAEQRAALVQAMACGLSSDDEPFLASAMRDRSAGVRLAAAELLRRLPSSELAKRSLVAAEALVRVTPPKGGMLAKLASLVKTTEPTVEASLPPETFDAAWEADGLVEHPPVTTLGPRQWWLAQRVAAVPASHWLERAGVAPAVLVGAFARHEYGDALLDGLTAAVLRDRTPGFAAPLWDAWWGKERTPSSGVAPLPALTSRLAGDEIEPRAREMLAVGGSSLRHLPLPWPRGLVTDFVAAVTRHGRLNDDALEVAALALPDDVLGQVLATPAPPPSENYVERVYARSLDRFQSLVAMRRAIAREIHS